MADHSDDDSEYMVKGKSTSGVIHGQHFDETFDVTDGEEVSSAMSMQVGQRRDIPRRGDTPPDHQSEDEGGYEDDELKSPGGGDEYNEDDSDGSVDGEKAETQRQLVEGAYDPKEYEHLNVSQDVRELFQYITRYT
eukprot:Colp12_sorted_trinity150504_noHs@21772